jgi:hypothetical protein
MNIGDVIYIDGKASRKSGLIVAGRNFRIRDYPELAEVYGFRYDWPDQMKVGTTPPIPQDPLGRTAHIVASRRGQQYIRLLSRSS